MRAAAWSQARDIGAAVVSWDRAARLADELPGDDGDRLAMRIAPRTMLCANGWRIREPIAGKRFEELEDLCAAAGDKASIAIATTGLLGEHFMTGRLPEASRVASEQMVLIHAIGDPTLTVGLSVGPIASKILTGEMAEVLRSADDVIDLAEGDGAMGGYVVKSPLALAYAMRCTARWWLGQAGWQEDFDRALVMARDADPMSHALGIAYTYSNAISSGVIAADDAALRDIDEALQSAERSADDLALGFALYTKANALWKHDSAQRERALELLRQLREMAVDGRFYPMLVPVIDVRFAEEMVRREDPDGVRLLSATVDELFSSGLFGVRNLGHRHLGERPAESRYRQRYSGGRGCARALVRPRCARRIRVSRPHRVEIEGSARPRPRRRGRLSRLRDSLPHHGEIAWLRRTHGDRRGDGGRGRYRTADRWCVNASTVVRTVFRHTLASMLRRRVSGRNVRAVMPCSRLSWHIPCAKLIEVQVKWVVGITVWRPTRVDHSGTISAV